MGVGRNDEIQGAGFDPVGQPDDLAGARRSVACGTCMSEQHRQVRPQGADFAEHVVDGEGPLAEAKPGGLLRLDAGLGVGRNVAHHRHLHGAHIHHAEGDDPVRAPAVAASKTFAASQGIPGLRHPLPEGIQRPLKVVLRERGRRDAETVQYLAPWLVPGSHWH